MFSTVDDVQYCGGCSELGWIFSTIEDVQYGGGGCSVLRMVLEGVQYYDGCWVFSAFDSIQYCGGCSVLWMMFSTVVDVQY